MIAVTAELAAARAYSQKQAPVTSMLMAIKILHTVIWAFFAGCILVLPVAAVLRRFRWAIVLIVPILLECGVLLTNQGRCPLTDLATRYTSDRRPNFDIFLPSWLALHNKTIFGALFAAGVVVVLGCWLKQKLTASAACQPSPRNPA